MTNSRPSLHDRAQVISSNKMPTNLDDLCAQPVLFRGVDLQDQDYMVSASKIERDLDSGKVLECMLHLVNLEIFEGIDFLIAERLHGGHVALLPNTPSIVIPSLPDFFEALTVTYRADVEYENALGISSTGP
jgi:polysaccharide pyruvyl transferase WcaK-like protein